jgi:hypothetical protein
MADGYLLPFIAFPFNLDSLHITFSAVALPCNRHLTSKKALISPQKKPAKKSFRVLAGM